MLKSRVLLINNSHVLQLFGLKNGLTDEFLSTAVVSATLKDNNGDDVLGQTWPIALSYVADSDGNYHAILNHDLELKQNKRYHLQITASVDGLQATWDEYIKAEVRR